MCTYSGESSRRCQERSAERPAARCRTNAPQKRASEDLAKRLSCPHQRLLSAGLAESSGTLAWQERLAANVTIDTPSMFGAAKRTTAKTAAAVSAEGDVSLQFWWRTLASFRRRKRDERTHVTKDGHAGQRQRRSIEG